jgi:tetratricopeptide (TPR) repeat protein
MVLKILNGFNLKSIIKSSLQLLNRFLPFSALSLRPRVGYVQTARIDMKMHRLRPHNSLMPVLVCLMIAGCSTSKSKVAPPRTALEMVVNQAETELAKGKRDQAIALLSQAAKENPSSVVPWLKLSTIWFNSAKYPTAILTANEVLQREPENQEAKSILVVAGLRVAAGALSGLVPEDPVNPSVRAEADTLIKALRATLGEKDLIPVTCEIKPVSAPVAEVVPSCPPTPTSSQSKKVKREREIVVTSRTRINGGNPCPKSGYWFTPAQVNSLRHFEKGEIMPVLGSDYGDTVWQWDRNYKKMAP